MKDHVRLPLFSHITRVLERGELRSERLEWLNVDPGDQILLKIQSAQNLFKSNGCVGLVVMNPTQLVLGSNGRRMREISRSVQIVKQAKKNVLTVQSVQSVRMLTWQGRTTHGRC
jgi:hypothetical protein